MFQTFEVTAEPQFGAARLEALRATLAGAGFDGFIVPRADLHQGEYVAPCDARLQWLTGFTGSAGFCVVLPAQAGVFVDGRYRTQVKAQVDLAAFTPVNWPEVKTGDWILAHAAQGARIAYDPWLHTAREIAEISDRLAGSGISLQASPNWVDRVWADRPAPPCGAVAIQPLGLKVGRVGTIDQRPLVPVEAQPA
ncbi:MAG: aminopeptidase P family N-terminal domain-containing protein, partial [Rhodobacteraceae bacterium]|nr:aminopeptidase P family N-terminal domain-containing protein [Paracoccaceae bacterium]